MKDLKKVHGIMTYLTVEDSSMFRKGAEGVFDGDRCIFIAPPADLVPSLMDQLFQWMKKNAKIIHPLILSSVFHYEFLFIHPFSDGNGRMARLWQTVLLSDWNPVFQYIPLESQIEKFQDAYYKAIGDCHINGNSTVFVEFMLDKINEVIREVLVQSTSLSEVSIHVQKLLEAMDYDVSYTSNEILEMLGFKSRQSLHQHYLDPAINAGLIQMTIPDKPNSRNQRYVKI